MEPRIILHERCETIGGRSREWWIENIGDLPKQEREFSYRKRGAKIFDIKNVIEIPNNKNECCVLFYDGEEITVKGSFATVYEEWISAEEFMDDELENFPL